MLNNSVEYCVINTHSKYGKVLITRYISPNEGTIIDTISLDCAYLLSMLHPSVKFVSKDKIYLPTENTINNCFEYSRAVYECIYDRYLRLFRDNYFETFQESVDRIIYNKTYIIDELHKLRDFRMNEETALAECALYE